MSLLTPIDTVCPRCADQKRFMLEAARVERWRGGGEYIQRVFPELSADDRERLVSGICPTCWNYIFGEDEEPTPGQLYS